MARLPCLLALLLATACAPAGGVLVGPGGNHRLVARDPSTGVSLVVTTGSWDGRPPNLPRQLTVVHALVANMGRAPIRLAPGDFELVSDRGFARAVLDAGGSFSVAQQDGDAPPRYSEGRGGYPLGASPNVVSLNSDSRDVHALALPWGVLYPGTDMRGFLYFEQVETISNSARLVWHVHDASGRHLVDLGFDLVVARPKRP